MRILRVAPWLYPDTKGGGQYHVHAMSRDQAAMGHDVTVLTTRVDESLPQIEETDGYTVVRVSPGVNILGNDVSPAVARYLWKQSGDFDVIHAHSHLYFVTNLAALTRRLGGPPLAITNHGLYSQSAPERLFRWYLKTLGRWTFNQADTVFCYTETDKQRVRDLGVTSRIEVVPNGVDTERFRSDGPVSERIDHDGYVVLFVGRLVEGKRPMDVIQAVSRLDDDIHLYICGDGPLRSELEATAGPQVTFLGLVPHEEMPEVYRAADLLVLPSRAEGTPRTIMEALSTGVPVVCSDLPQVRSVFGECVRYTSKEDIEEIASAIKERIDADQAPTLSQELRWNQTVKKTTINLKYLTSLNEDKP
ncbi:Glycosyltransferase [Halalkaliarchaeum sp. AArc-CO]|uniref:glycosyltransferase family 4 protein n=1 Tax=Halalkaliarchaeum sp. AArc-CO TaxID=2866381 RepID=UPI00217E61EF|nr:glycosyltransferase family 4 protein [Halalkaliarchaeum sp. AArc-CO]UWG52013.1 Glycosyltransferase [Halalkaliarchaeum sp. AArc-CO]